MDRVIPCVGMSKKCILMNPFFTSQFSYCPLVWMCHSLAKNSKINRPHERCLQIVYNDKQPSFNKFHLMFHDSVLIHMTDIQILAIEMHKLINNLSQPIKNRVNNDVRYTLKQILQFSRSQLRLIYHRTDVFLTLDQKHWVYYLMIIKS